MGRWRALVLVGVHVVIAIHVVQWVVMGSTVSPVEPSESMQTLELGVVNAGFIFFVLAILSTIIFGRFLCGWGCHVVALQDLCAWLMKKARTKPKPFRSRLLVFAPLALGIYMFVWPTFKRIALIPAIEAAGFAVPVWIGQPAEFHGFTSELIVEDFWATFPPWYVAIPFLGVCGFASVYFLGSKGFCTYGCPYGGIFGVADQVSPGRIVVNDSCEGSGHCTAVCTSNVRVHEEVRDFGAVVDPGCMKCMDCVSACPNDALSFAMTKPALLIGPRDDDAKKRRARINANPKRFDLTWPEEVAAAVMALGLFVAFRGMLNLVPMLMAVGMAGVGVFLIWKAWRVVTTHNVRLQSYQLRAQGRVRIAGLVVLVGAAVTLVSAGWSGLVGLERWRAHLTHETIEVPVALALRPEFDLTPDKAERVLVAIERFERSDAWGEGGRGWSLRPMDRRELAFLYLLVDRHADAARQLDRLGQEGEPTDELVEQAAALRRQLGQSDEDIKAWLADMLYRHPLLHGARLEWSRLAVRTGEPVESVDASWRDALGPEPALHAAVSAATFYTETGRSDAGAELIERASMSEDVDAAGLVRAARTLAATGRVDRGLELLDRASDLGSQTPESSRALGVAFASLGERDRARAVYTTGLETHPDSAALHEALALLDLVEARPESALEHYRTAIRLAGRNPFARAGLGESVVRAGLGSRTQAVYELGLDAMRTAAEQSQAGVLFHDLGQALLAGGRAAEGLEALERAQALTPENQAVGRSLEQARAVLNRRGTP